LYTTYRVSSLHSPMAGAFNDEGYKNEYVLSLKNVLAGKKIKYAAGGHELNRPGQAKGELVGGNLALLAHLTGTGSDIKTKGRILFIEDVGEQLYNIDRMMYQLKRSGKLFKLAGLIFGGFTETKDTDRPFGKTVHQLLQDIIAEYDYPVCFDFPVSHTDRNYALKVGVEYTLKVTKSRVLLQE
jgi:muramoyltetrapeptide carboxypeptidase